MRAELYVRGTVTRIEGPLMILERNVSVGLDESVEVLGRDGRPRLGRVATVDDEHIVVEVLESTDGLDLRDTRVRLHGRAPHFGVGDGVLGRVFNGVGEVIDGGPPVAVERWLPLHGRPLNPSRRVRPHEFIETGVSSIDLLNSLVRGQKLPIFSAGGLPHDRMMAEIAQRARLPGEDQGDFVVVFVGIGIPYDTADRFRRAMERSGALERTAMFLNLASESSTQRLLAPRYALTAAEYLAFDRGKHVLVVMTDITNYCEALREVSASHGEIPGRKGYPGYMYSDLATIYERAGVLAQCRGSLTQLLALTMPAGDISHPIPDLTGYITEGQIVLDRDLDQRGIYPPVAVLPSLSRLMKDGIGEGLTHRDHPAQAHQLYATYARATRVRMLASVVGQEGLTDLDRQYLSFADRFETELVDQPDARTLEQSMAIGWELLRSLPVSELHRLTTEQIAAYIGGDASDGPRKVPS